MHSNINVYQQYNAGSDTVCDGTVILMFNKHCFSFLTLYMYTEFILVRL